MQSLIKPADKHSAGDIIARINSPMRMLHDSLRELGLDQAITEIVETIPDACDRLYYIVQMAAQATERVLNSARASQPHQDQVEGSVRALTQRWGDWFAGPIDLVDTRELATDTWQFLADVPVHTSPINVQLLEIVMAQDFQDLIRQAIKRMMDVIQGIECQLLMVLLENIPEQESCPGHENQNLLDGPQVSTSKAGVVTSQDQMDGLLDSLGF